MIWESWQAFWAMGGYGLYVWGSFGVTLLCIMAEVGLLRRHRLQVWRRLKRMKSWDSQ
ncbi:MAG: heme exporter protein CcmD [Thiobacillus sp.]|nr:heme exporter protein CcmD [Thiobacillus sp.]